jgi:type IV pilus assembly protein PilW
MSRSKAHGFTLLEMMVGVAITSLVLLGVAAAFIASQRSFQIEGQTKTAIEGSRTAVSYLERQLKLAGYGLHPAGAVDFSTTVTGAAKQDVVAGDTITDDLAIRYRDPYFIRQGTIEAGEFTLPVDEELGVNLREGQVVLFACRGRNDHLVARLNANVAAAATSFAFTNYNIYGGAVPNTTPACFTGGGEGYAFLVHEKRFRIRRLGAPGQERPFLVVFHNLADSPATAANFDPLAADVEAFHVSYVMNRPRLGSPNSAANPSDGTGGNENWVMGDAAGDAMPNPALTVPPYTEAYDGTPSTRFTAHPANIRSIRITLAVRSTSALGGGQGVKFANLRVPLENDPTDPDDYDPDAFYRAVVTSTVRLPNMLSRSFFIPPLHEDPNAPSEQDLNFRGG